MSSKNILDQPVPKINTPILKPSTYKRLIPSLKALALNKVKTAQTLLNNFADWIISYSPPVIKTKVSEAFSKILSLFSTIKVKSLKTALKGFTKSYEISMINNDVVKQLNETIPFVKTKLKHDLKNLKGIKAMITLKINFQKIENRNKTINRQAFFNSKANIILKEENISEMLNNSTNEIVNKIGNWLSEGSSWTMKCIDNHYVNLVKFTPLKGNSFLQLPAELRHSNKGLINIKNEDNECFRWCHLAKIYCNQIKNHPERISHYKKYVNTLNYNNIKFPVSIKQIPKIEEQNSISINVFGYEDKLRFPLYISKRTEFKSTLDLFLITEGEKQHFVSIKDFNKFMFNQNNHKNKKHFCRYCLQCFSTKEILLNHTSNCIIINGQQAIKMLKKGSTVKFKNFHNQLPVPFVIYADFEALTQKVDSCQPDENKSYSEKYQQHIDCSFVYKLVCCYDDKFSKPIQLYWGENAVYKFLESMLREVEYCKKTKKKHFDQPMVLTDKEENDFKLATECHICKRAFTEQNNKVRDHCHITSNYRGAAHNSCNRSFRLTEKIPVIFHNLRGYDSHFIMQEIGKFGQNIDVIPNNMEKYLAFFLGKHLKFIDSFQFMSNSLESLVKNLSLEDMKYIHRKNFKMKN